MKYITAFFFCSLIIVALNLLSSKQATAQQTTGKIDTNFFHDMQFRTVGPTRGGRVAAVAGIPGAPYSFYMGNGPEGGVWRTNNAG